MKLNDEIILEIEKFINDGKCIAHHSGMPVFVENVCPGDKIKAKILKINKSYITAEVLNILSASEWRTEPFCAMQNVCGSCDRQFIEYEEQLKQKTELVRENLKNFIDENCRFEEAEPSPKIKEYRCKVQYPVSRTKNSKRLLTGYYKKKSHELINIKYCPVHPEIISIINEDFKQKAQELGISAYNEKNNSGLLRHIIYRISSDLSQILVIFVVNSDSADKKLKQAALYLKDKFPQITGICVNYNKKKTNVITGEKTETVCGNDYYEENISGYKYRVSKTGFFQVNPYCAEKILLKVKELVKSNTENPRILDAYSGVSTFGIYLSDIAKEVVCIEEVKSASDDAKTNAEINKIKNIKVINGDAAKEFKKLIGVGETFNITVTDPPRKGCSKDSVEFMSKLTKDYIVYVSCNPVTLARDIGLFKEQGFIPVYIKPFDMFPHSYHIETVALLKKINK